MRVCVCFSVCVEGVARRVKKGRNLNLFQSEQVASRVLLSGVWLEVLNRGHLTLTPVACARRTVLTLLSLSLSPPLPLLLWVSYSSTVWVREGGDLEDFCTSHTLSVYFLIPPPLSLSFFLSLCLTLSLLFSLSAAATACLPARLPFTPQKDFAKLGKRSPPWLLMI